MVSGLWLVSYVALWVLVLLLGVSLIAVLYNLGAMYGHLRRDGNMQSLPSGLPGGVVLPEVAWRTLDGQERTPASYLGHKRAFVVLSPSCSGCQDYLRQMGRADFRPDPLDDSVTQAVVISLATATQTADMIKIFDLYPDENCEVLVDDAQEVVHHWGTEVLPTVIIVDEELRVVRQVFGGTEPAGRRAPVA
jgi:hypothetical protein